MKIKMKSILAPKTPDQIITEFAVRHRTTDKEVKDLIKNVQKSKSLVVVLLVSIPLLIVGLSVFGAVMFNSVKMLYVFSEPENFFQIILNNGVVVTIFVLSALCIAIGGSLILSKIDL